MSAPCTVDFQDDKKIAIVTLNDPKTGNAMSPEMGDAFRDIMTDLAKREGLRVVIIRGAGENFSIGGQRDMLVDLGGDKFNYDSRRDYMLGYYAKWLALIDVPVPVIAAIEGQCIGVAPVFAFVCDIALADEAAQFEITFAKAGFFPGMGLVKLVPDAIGRSRAGLALIAGARISGAEAEQMGVIARSVPAGSVHEAALALARRIIENAEEVVRHLVSSLRVKREDLDDQLVSDAEAQASDYATPEFRKRIANYLPGFYDK